MELGNILFGNSRGEHAIPRDAGFEKPLADFMDKALLHPRGLPSDVPCPFWRDEEMRYDDGRVVVRPYDWGAECDCGAEAHMGAWLDENPHADDCYQSELDRELVSVGARLPDGGLPDLDEVPFDERERRFREVVDRLAAKHGVDPHYGCMVHCTCGRDERADAEWERVGGHSENCRLVLPNFWDRITGLKVNWYKYPLRDAYMNMPADAERFRTIMAECANHAALARREAHLRG